MRKFFITLMIVCGLSAAAQSSATTGILVTAPDNSHQFAIDGINNITFGDTALSVNLLSGESYSFDNATGWVISLGDYATGIVSIDADKPMPASVYDINGRKVCNLDNMSHSALGTLPSGTYIIITGGHAIKYIK